MVAMESKQEIPCAACRSWNGKAKKFSCKPHDCQKLSVWLQCFAPQLRENMVEMQVQFPEAIPYVV